MPNDKKLFMSGLSLAYLSSIMFVGE